MTAAGVPAIPGPLFYSPRLSPPEPWLPSGGGGKKSGDRLPPLHFHHYCSRLPSLLGLGTAMYASRLSFFHRPLTRSPSSQSPHTVSRPVMMASARKAECIAVQCSAVQCTARQLRIVCCSCSDGIVAAVRDTLCVHFRLHSKSIRPPSPYPPRLVDNALQGKRCVEH